MRRHCRTAFSKLDRLKRYYWIILLQNATIVTWGKHSLRRNSKYGHFSRTDLFWVNNNSTKIPTMNVFFFVFIVEFEQIFAHWKNLLLQLILQLTELIVSDSTGALSSLFSTHYLNKAINSKPLLLIQKKNR